MMVIGLALFVASWNAPDSAEYKLLASDGSEDDFFGCAVSVSGEFAIVGARLDDIVGEGSGSAYLFGRQKDGGWLEIQKLEASDGSDGD